MWQGVREVSPTCPPCAQMDALPSNVSALSLSICVCEDRSVVRGLPGNVADLLLGALTSLRREALSLL